MPSERLRAMAAVDAQVAAGLTFQDWRKVVQHPDDPGIDKDEGDELQGDLEAEEKPYLEDVDEALVAADNEDVQHLDARPAVPLPVNVAAAPGDDPAEVEDARLAAKRLDALQRLRADAAENRVPAAFFAVDREVQQLQRGLRPSKGGSQTLNNVLRRNMAEAAAKESAKLRAQRAAARRRALAVKKTKANAAKVKKIQAAAKAKKASTAAKIAALPKSFAAKDLCHPGPAGTKTRADCLERLRLRAPPLALEDKVRWAKVRDAYAKHIQHILKVPVPEQVGAAFIEKINEVIGKLKGHYSGLSVAKDLPGGCRRHQ